MTLYREVEKTRIAYVNAIDKYAKNELHTHHSVIHELGKIERCICEILENRYE